MYALSFLVMSQIDCAINVLFKRIKEQTNCMVFIKFIMYSDNAFYIEQSPINDVLQLRSRKPATYICRRIVACYIRPL